MEKRKTVFDGTWKIVYRKDAAAVEKTACRELQYFLSGITGKEIPAVAEDGGRQEKAVLVATKETPFAAFEKYRDSALGDEGVFYSVEDGIVFIGGGSVRGVLYSAYTFLEEEFGVRRYTEELEVVPKAEKTELAQKVYSYVPPMHYRAASFEDGSAAPYCTFNKMNARSSIPEEAGGMIDFGIGFAHTIGRLVPDELFNTHPEYFPMIDGKRSCGRGYQRCLTNPEVLAMTVGKVLADFRAHPEHKTASVSQEDTGEVPYCCTCPECARVNAEEGSLMGTQLRFVNAVADAVREEFPDRFIDTLAFSFTRHVPKLTRPRSNVIIRLCSIECCFSHPIECPEPANEAFVKDMRDWAEIAENIYIWDYVTNFHHYLAPQPNIPVLGPNMRFFIGHRTVGMFPEGAPDSRGSELSELKSWLLAKLMWNPGFDTERGTEEFVSAYAGAGAGPVLAYIRRLNERAAIMDSHRGCYAKPDRAFFDEAFLSAAEADFAEAKALAGDETALRRIRRWEMPVRYIRLILYPERFTQEELGKEEDAFISDMAELGVTKLREGSSYGRSREILEQRIRETLEKP